MASIGIKAKVTAAVTVFTAVVTAAVLAAVFFMVVDQNTKATQSNLRDRNETVSSELEVDSGMVIADDSVFVEEATYSAVYNTEGHFLCGYMPSAELDELPFSCGQMQQYDTWVVYDAEYKLKHYGTVRIRSTTNTQSNLELFERIRLLALAGVVVITVAVALGCYLIMRRFFKPLDTINKTTSAISSGNDLSQRIPVRAPHDEFYQLGSSFNEMLDRLERSFEKEQRFSNSASHELRTPITVILSETDYALSGEASQQEQQLALEKIRDQASLMSGLTSQLLLISRAERGDWGLEREEVDLSELTELVSETGKEIASQKNIQVTTDIAQGIKVQGDPNLLMRMVLNLVENAVRYGRKDGHILVSLSASNGCALGSVKDDGIGISKEHLPFIWDRFYQANPARGGLDKGSGLGLSMVKFIAGAHGGEVACESEPGLGSTFTFKIPLEP